MIIFWRINFTKFIIYILNYLGLFPKYVYFVLNELDPGYFSINTISLTLNYLSISSYISSGLDDYSIYFSKSYDLLKS